MGGSGAAGSPAARPAGGVAAAAALEESLAKMRLEVLVYSEQPAERLVFINGRKYVEGQSVDGKLLVESITREGAILSYEGQRLLLRHLRP